MHIALNNQFRVVDGKLKDMHLGSTYTLSRDALWLLSHLNDKQETGEFARVVAKQRGIPIFDARQGIAALISQVGSFGAVDFTPDNWFDRMALLRWYLVVRQRQPSTAKGLLVSVARAYGLLTVLLAAAFIAMRLYLGEATAFDSFLAVPFVLVASFALHEAGHMFAAKKAKIKTTIIAGAAYMAIMYRETDLKTGKVIAASGPVLAGVACGICAALLQSTPLLAALCGLTGVFHMFNLLPFSADGRALWRSK